MNFENDPRLRRIDMSFYRRSFVTGETNENRLRIQYYFRDDDGHLFAGIWFGPEAEGPPDFAHGGALAAILDEAMGVMAWFNKYPVVTVNISIDYRNLMPLEHEAVLETWIERTEGRKIYTYGAIRCADGTVVTSANGIFLTLPMEKFGPHREFISSHYGLEAGGANTTPSTAAPTSREERSTR